MILKHPAIRLSLVLVLLTVNLLFLANLIGFVPNNYKIALEQRKKLSESLATQFSISAENGAFQIIRNTLRMVVERNDDVRSAAIRTYDGKLIAMAGEHLAHWVYSDNGKSTPTHVQVPVFREGEKWATVEIRFSPLWTGGLSKGFTNSFTGLVMFLVVGGFLCNFIVLKKTLRELDPSVAIPKRVQSAFDILQEGVLILDENEQIVMANRFVCDLVGEAPEVLIGQKGSEIGWMSSQTPEGIRQLPWNIVLRDGHEKKGASLILINRLGYQTRLAVNAGRVLDGSGKCRGVLVTLDDITQLEEKNFELDQMNEMLKQANLEIKGKSEELEFLASCDPMTKCLNRRSLAQQFDVIYRQAIIDETELSCLMMDIDFFKSVNDNYGHSIGDEVIKMVAGVLKSSTRENDLVGRYGGEEFCVVLPGLDLSTAAKIADRIRKKVEQTVCEGINVTISLGVTSIEFNAGKPDEMIDQADKALYAAKKSGRNRVITWGDDLDLIDGEESDTEATPRNNRNETKGEPSDKPESGDGDPEKLKARISELEGLLERRNLALKHIKMYDLKTGMPTRSMFEDRIAHEIARSKRMNTLVAVLSIKIDTIKRVNETLGNKVAGKLMKACGKKLNTILRGNIDAIAVINRVKETSSVSLINETEFGILLPDINQTDDVTWIMKRLLEAFKAPFLIDDNEIHTSVYFGVSLFPHDGQTAEELYRSATTACRHAHQQKLTDRYLFASDDLNEMAANKLQIENLLHDAILNEELQLYYQPKIESSSGRIAGFEALLRWQSPRLGFVSPDQFIQVAEQSGQIDELGDWVIQRACRQLRTWMDMGLEVEPVAVNMSGLQLGQKNLARRIQEILDKFRIAPNLLEIELTESSLVYGCDLSLSILNQIKELGLRVTMDDFGTGYSSLSYLRDIPLSCIKIDKAFITDLNKDERADKLIAAMVSIAHGLELDIVAEGVEEKYQAEHLIALGCQYLQGYYFSRPVPHDDIVAMLQKKQMTAAL